MAAAYRARFLAFVHPDRFHSNFAAKCANEKAVQDLNSLISLLSLKNPPSTNDYCRRLQFLTTDDRLISTDIPPLSGNDGNYTWNDWNRLVTRRLLDLFKEAGVSIPATAYPSDSTSSTTLDTTKKTRDNAISPDAHLSREFHSQLQKFSWSSTKQQPRLDDIRHSIAFIKSNFSHLYFDQGLGEREKAEFLVRMAEFLQIHNPITTTLIRQPIIVIRDLRRGKQTTNSDLFMRIPYAFDNSWLVDALREQGRK